MWLSLNGTPIWYCDQSLSKCTRSPEKPTLPSSKKLCYHRFLVNVLPLIPSAIHQLVNHKLIDKTDLSSLVSVHSGAAYLPPALSEKLKTFVKNVPHVLEGCVC